LSSLGISENWHAPVLSRSSLSCHDIHFLVEQPRRCWQIPESPDRHPDHQERQKAPDLDEIRGFRYLSVFLVLGFGWYAVFIGRGLGPQSATSQCGDRSSASQSGNSVS
jgi:hypothetical protein